MSAKDSSNTDLEALLAKTMRWGCQFQKLDLAAVANSSLDLIVVDHAHQGRPFRSSDVNSLKRKPDGSRRLVLAYLSVGEAENYRPYWRPEWAEKPPRWLGPENPNWPNSFNVRYWDKSWQDIVYSGPQSILQGILESGFDGVFLDRVDAFDDWPSENVHAAESMVAFVEAMAQYARQSKPKFLVIGQNSEPLLKMPRYRRAINAVSKESLLFSLNAPELQNSPPDVAWSLNYLKIAQKAGLKILAIEYLQDAAKIETARQRHGKYGFTPFFANRPLDRLPGLIEAAANEKLAKSPRSKR